MQGPGGSDRRGRPTASGRQSGRTPAAWWWLPVFLLIGACSALATDATSAAPTTTVPATTTTTAPRDCSPRPRSPGNLPPDDPVAASVLVSRSTFPCAEEVVLASTDADAAWTAAAIAVGRPAPLLLVTEAVRGDTASEISRLEPEALTLVGLDGLDASVFERYELRTAEPEPGSPRMRPQQAEQPSRLWLVSPSAGSAAAVWAGALAAGDALVPVEVDDLRAVEGAARQAITSSGDAEPVWVGSFGDDAGWKLEVVRAARRLHGGGQLLFPGRRLVALYGNPTTPALGVLGEQGPAEAVQRLLRIAAEYATPDVEVLPGFEIIATVASAGAGADGDYSEEMTVEQLRPWVDVAREQGVYVILDLQPGRTDFLTQARRYEELLREPHVGLALDPEWRLGPDQVHLQQIGTVDAAEINQVAEWLAGIVREEALPQKLLLLHQFRFSMITNRESVVTPAELAVVVQMDGQGPLPTKYETWDALTAGTDQAGYRWGWKNFYDEDSPTATPAEVLALDPVPVYVSYQ